MEILLGVLGAVGCVAMMGLWMLLPKLVRRHPALRRLSDRAVAVVRRQSTLDRLLSWVEAEQPDLARATAPDGTVTLMFSDIEESTRLNTKLGDEHWLEVLGEHNAIVRAAVGEHGGCEVKSQGDGFMIAFRDPTNAVRAACDIQRGFSRRGADHAQEPLTVRIGLHTGEAIQRDGDFFGRNVALAARITERAAGGEIVASDRVRQRVETEGRFDFGEPREVELKGFDELQRVHPVGWESHANVVDLRRTTAA